MPDNPLVAHGNQREDIGVAKKLTHERNQIFIREGAAIQLLDRRDIARIGQPVPHTRHPTLRAPLQNRFNSRSM